MQSPPAIRTSVTRSRGLGWAGLVISVFSLMACGAAGTDSDYVGALILLGFLSALAAWYSWWHSPCGQLSWDGRQWFWSGFQGESLCALQIHFDLQYAVLLHLRHHSGQSIWLFLDRKACSAQWISLRRALQFGHVMGHP